MKQAIIGLLLLTILSFIAVVVYPWFRGHLGLIFTSDPPKPEITYGEFPFRLEYEINGQRVIIEDTLICEFDGFGINEAQGRYRKWKGYLASGREHVVLHEVAHPVSLQSEKKVVKQLIYYPIGSPRYYMGDVKEFEGYSETFPDAILLEQYEDGSSSNGVIYADELLERFGIKLISWEAAEPIKNRF